MARITEERLNELNCSTITDREIRKLVKAYRKKSGGWIEWGGGEFPKELNPTTIVDVRFRDGTKYGGGSVMTWRNNWFHNRSGADIIAYRVAK